MSERIPCASCGIAVRAADLSVVGDTTLCPRCYALAAPATLAGRPKGRVVAAPASPPAPGAGRALEGRVREWAAGRLWWVRAPLVAWMGWILVRQWGGPWRPTLWQGIDLAIHEIGHILWSPLGELMGVAGGTITQLLAPVAAGAVLYRQRDWFGVSVAVCWLGINCFEISHYAGDALTRRLPLVSPTTSTPMHDWAYLLGELGLLRHTDAVAAAWLWAGRLTLGAGVLFGAWVLRLMATTPSRGHAPPRTQP